ncbi:MAG: aminodeoxychorismate synthase component I, partial [Saprospiraceae bacterium]
MLQNVILRDVATQEWLHFNTPVRVLVARQISEVVPILQVVERWNKMGYYIAGYLSYEASAAFDSALETEAADDFPLAVFGIYEEVIRKSDFKNQESNVQLPTKNYQLKTPLDWQQSLSENEYHQHFQNIQDAIQRGDTYQVNFCLRQWADFKDQPLDLFQNMAANAPYAAFLEWDNYAICSASPELFFTKKENTLTCRPMKGTIGRGRTTKEDQAQVEILKASAKDRAENVMIVDMIRNDLGRIARAGTVQFPHLYSIEKYPTVWQMTSTVTAETDATFSEMMTALFPCASITGAPKASTMQIIKKVEQVPRHIYTGTIGFITPNGDMQFNVAIRTALINKQLQQIEYGMGGGVTVQSNATNEYAECQLKTEIIKQQRPDFSLLETMRWTPQEGVFLLNHHLNRLADSADYFAYPIDQKKITEELDQLNFASPQKLRLLVQANGDFQIENAPLEIDESLTWQVALATQPIDKHDVFLFHKTTQRNVYQQFIEQYPTAQDVILHNQQGELTESCYGNIIIEKAGIFYTPPIACGLLNGTLRAQLVELGWLQEEILYAEDLAEADNVYIINSVRKFIKIKGDWDAEKMEKAPQKPVITSVAQKLITNYS